ncbi:Cilia- and flagella-associated protein 45 [Tritrichomonas musculus]|uniref:Cilia- and flagella-associated protein 45 n=1 Tax=Tritrichomonas musculus TaxID=1915356 RepID=A0ABR2KKU4_9EUKA
MRHNPKFTTRIGNVHVDAAIMNRRDWRRVKKEAVHLTAAQQMAYTKELDEKKRTQTRAIKDKRRRLIEAERTKQETLKNLATQQEMDEREYALKVAEAKANEELDEVKAMNEEMMCARVRTIRDAQLELNKQRRLEEKEEEARMAKMLEEGRQRALQIYANRERMLLEQRKKGGAVILAQIEEKKRNQQLERERRDREIQALKEADKAAREEEIRINEEKKKRASEFLSECLAANSIALQRRQQEKERELEENAMMAEYQRQKAAREEEYEKKVLQAKRLKEYEIAEVRKKQQRAIDTKAQEDELRARRIEEEQERKARQKEIEELKRRQELLIRQKRDQDEAIQLKQKRIIELAKIEKADFERIIAVQRAARERERIEMEKKKKRNQDYRDELKAEMERKREEKRLIPLANLDEQKHCEELQQDYIDRIERIRQMKLEQLASEGVPEKYLADLRRKRFVIK